MPKKYYGFVFTPPATLKLIQVKPNLAKMLKFKIGDKIEIINGRFTKVQ